MYKLQVAGILLAGVFVLGTGLAQARDDDNDNGHGGSKGKKNEKSWVFNFPFTSVGTSTDALAAQIKSLQEALAKLKAEREALEDADDSDDGDRDDRNANRAARDALKIEIKQTKSEIKDAKRELKFFRSLARGMSGDDVRDLQELLAQDPTIFSLDLITGFFGPKTEEALRKFQRKHGIDAIGIFGPKTQAKILALFIGRELPPGIIKRLGLEMSSTTPGTGFLAICHIPPGNVANKQTLVIGIPALGAHLAHGDTVGVCAGSGTATTTPPAVDTTAPIISGIGVSGISSTTAAISWNTNENAVSKVFYATSSPVNVSTALSVGTASSTMFHMHSLTGLAASTTHYFVVQSKDAANNTATSSVQSFLTLP